MFTPTETQVIPSPFLLTGLSALVAASAPFNGLKVDLFQNNLAPSRQTKLADVVVATFDGYAESGAITWSSPFYDVDGSALTIGSATGVTFPMTGSTTPNVIYGWYMKDTAGTALALIDRFITSVGMSIIGDACPVVPWLRYSGT